MTTENETHENEMQQTNGTRYGMIGLAALATLIVVACAIFFGNEGDATDEINEVASEAIDDVQTDNAEPLKGITAKVQAGAFWLDDGVWSILTAGEHYHVYGVATSVNEDGEAHENPYLAFAGGEREGNMVPASCLVGVRGKQKATEDCPAFQCQETLESDCSFEPEVEEDVQVDGVDKVLASVAQLTARVVSLEGTVKSYHPAPKPEVVNTGAEPEEESEEESEGETKERPATDVESS